MDIAILLVLVFIVWKTMKFVYDLMNKKISKINNNDNTTNKDKDDDS